MKNITGNLPDDAMNTNRERTETNPVKQRISEHLSLYFVKQR